MPHVPGRGVGREELDGGVAAHAHLVAQRLAARRAINITDDNRLRIRVGRAERIPIGLHLFAMPSPRREELDEHGFSRCHLVKVGGNSSDWDTDDFKLRREIGLKQLKKDISYNFHIIF